MSPDMVKIIIGALLTLLGSVLTLVGAVIAGVFQHLNANRQREIEERKRISEERIKYRESLYKLAFEYWQHEQPRMKRQRILEEYMIRMDTFHTLFVEEALTDEKVNRKMDAFRHMIEAVKKQQASLESDDAI